MDVYILIFPGFASSSMRKGQQGFCVGQLVLTSQPVLGMARYESCHAQPCMACRVAWAHAVQVQLTHLYTSNLTCLDRLAQPASLVCSANPDQLICLSFSASPGQPICLSFSS